MNKLADDLWIGDVTDARSGPLDRLGITHVVTVCTAPVDEFVDCPADHFPLFDGPHDFATFERAVDRVRQLRSRGETVLVHCYAGISRSAAVCVAALAMERDEPVRDVLWDVKKTRNVRPHRLLRESAEEYVADRQ